MATMTLIMKVVRVKMTTPVAMAVKEEAVQAGKRILASSQKPQDRATVKILVLPIKMQRIMTKISNMTCIALRVLVLKPVSKQ